MDEREMTFGETVRWLRKRKKLSLRRLAEKCGISATYLSQIELGKLKAPSESIIRVMAPIIGWDTTAMIIKAGRIPSDLKEIIFTYPIASTFLLDSLPGILGKEDCINIPDFFVAFEDRMRNPGA